MRFFWSSSRHAALHVFDKSSEEHEARWRCTQQRAIATARPAAPCTSNVLREAWCLRLLSLRSFTRDWWQDRQNRAPVHRQNSSRISKLPPQPTHVALAALVWYPKAHPLLHSAPSIRLGWQDIFSSVTFRAVSSLSCKVRRVELGILGRQQVRFGAIYHITDYDTSAAALGAF